MSNEEIKKKQEVVYKLQKFLIGFHIILFVIVIVVIVLKSKNII